ncbi:ATP-binding cassette domain-containing protein [Streptomyces rimosus]|uniref:ATP-binding cassette domain-containing protein n=1 Tax=Streptomyces rimosus TaxID=1927 RepID=UPI00099D4FB9|nr:ATP-binding cassette domain-containing protein [Streptomyces rimosus]
MGGFEGSPTPFEYQDYAVTLDNVSKRYPDADPGRCALEDLSLGVRKGRFCAVMGPPKSGKTTLLQCMAGIVRPSSGTVRWGDAEADSIGVVRTDDLPHSGSSVRDFVSARPEGPQRSDRDVRNACRVARLWPRRRDVRELTAVQLKKATLARALADSPLLLLVDEPACRPGEEHSRVLGDIVRRAVRTLEVTAVMATDDPLAASRADSVVFLRDGRLVDAMAKASVDEITDCLHFLDER